MKTPQQIKNEVEKEIKEYDDLLNKLIMERPFDNGKYDTTRVLYAISLGKLSILTEYDKSIKEMIEELISNKSKPDSYVRNLKIINVRDIKELLSKLDKHIIKNDNIKIPKEIEGERNDLAVYNIVVYNIGFKEGRTQTLKKVKEKIKGLKEFYNDGEEINGECSDINYILNKLLSKLEDDEVGE